MAEEPEASNPDKVIWQEILIVLREVLPKTLKQRLHFADPAEVAVLCVIQLGYTFPSGLESEAVVSQRPTEPNDLSKWLAERAEALVRSIVTAPCVRDCDLAAEHNHSRTSTTRQAAIREEFRQRTEAHVNYLLQVLMEDRGVSEPGDVALETLADQVNEKLFSEIAFRRTASSYRPSGGSTFQRYLLREALWRSQDCVNAFLKHQPEMVSLDDYASSEQSDEGSERSLRETVADPAAVPPDTAATLREEAEQRFGQAKATLDELLDWLAANRVSERRQALVFLYFKAYVEPDIIPANVLDLVLGGREQLRIDYLKAQDELRSLQARFQESCAELDKATAVLRHSAEQLRFQFGLLAKDLLDLELIASRSTNAELEQELEDLDPSREQGWACQVRYMLASRRYGAAQRAREKRCAELQPYLDHQKPWIRSQQELADLLGISRGAAGRELAAIRALLRNSCHLQALFDDQPEDL